MKKLTLKLLATLLVAVGLEAATFNVDTAHSSVNFKVKHMMISNVKGSFDNFNGVIEFDEAKKRVESISGKIKSTSINTAIEKRDTHLRSGDFFDAENYPNITFSMDKIQSGKVYGKLKIKDVERSVVLDYDFGGEIKDPWGNQRIGMTLSGSIDRRDFGLKYNSILDNGGLSIGNKVKFDIEIEAIKQK